MKESEDCESTQLHSLSDYKGQVNDLVLVF